MENDVIDRAMESGDPAIAEEAWADARLTRADRWILPRASRRIGVYAYAEQDARASRIANTFLCDI
jgi:hypothetical protein